LSEPAIARAIAALKICAQKVAIHPHLTLRAIATQACRSAANGAAFLARVRQETGLALEVISAEEEAHLAVLGCRDLIDNRFDLALVVDIGGGSTELCWVDAQARQPEILAWTSLPVGVVSLAERFPEPEIPNAGWWDDMVALARGHVDNFVHAGAHAPAFATGKAHIVGTSGAISSIAGVYLGLSRYQRGKVDGIWMDQGVMAATVAQLVALGRQGRADHPCIGAERADLVAPGAAILQAVCDAWPVSRLRVADRGLREGVLIELIAAARGPA
jgi:exopolyphosphatase/guanosine-5'-triphosphate,3'-diphosphate pyrophosphatase